jgi:polysaccharide biosynthesis protein PslH
LKILFLLPFPARLDADHGGGRAVAGLLSRLADRHSLAVVYLRGQGEPELDENLRLRCDFVEEVLRPAVSWAGRSPILASLTMGKPVWALEWWVEDFSRAARRAAASWQPDIIQVEFSILGQYLASLEDCPAPRILVDHDPGAGGAADRQKYAGGLSKIKLGFDVWAWKRYERAIARRAQALVVFTSHDRDSWGARCGDTPMVEIPLGMDLPAEPLNPLGASPESILFYGSYSHPPNVDAARRLVKVIFPALHVRHPQLTLFLVGGEFPNDLRPSADQAVVGQRIKVTGRVKEVTPYLDSAAVIAAPLRLGGGMRVKVMEALGLGKAVVASPRAAAGLAVENGREILLAESDEDFVAAIDHLLASPEERKRLASQARQWAVANLRWEHTLNAYEGLYRRLLEAK